MSDPYPKESDPPPARPGAMTGTNNAPSGAITLPAPPPVDWPTRPSRTARFQVSASKSVYAHVVLLVLVLVLIIAPICINFDFARTYNSRLRWYLAARADMVANQTLHNEDFEARLGWLSTTEPSILPAGTSVIRESLTREVKKDSCLHSGDVAQLPKYSAEHSKRIVPVKIRTDVATLLKPQMKVSLLPAESATPSVSPNAVGPYAVVAVVPSTGEVTTVLLSLSIGDYESLPDGVTSRIWVPVLYPQPKQRKP